MNKKNNLLEQEKEDLRNTTNILEILENEGQEKYSILYGHAKAKIYELYKEKERMNEIIIQLKNENICLKANFTDKYNIDCKEKRYNYEILKENDKYQKKIDRMNKMIEELKSRIEVLYVELATKENKDNIISKES